MPITIRPSLSPDRELDLTQALTAAVAHALWECGGGNEVVNWLEAERFVASLSRPKLVRNGGRNAQRGRSESRRPRPERATGPIPYL